MLTQKLLKEGKSQKYIDNLELKDDVLIRQNGNPTYFTADIAYHKNKFDRGFTTLIDVWGADHHGHVMRMKGAMDAIGYDGDKLNVVLMQLVKLVKDGELVKMSLTKCLLTAQGSSLTPKRLTHRWTLTLTLQ